MKVTLACTLRQRLAGMMRFPDLEGALLLAPCHDVHTFGMKGPLDIAFVDGGLVVMASYRGVPPGRRVRCKGAAATLERLAAPGPWPAPGERLIAVSPGRPTPARMDITGQASRAAARGGREEHS